MANSWLFQQLAIRLCSDHSVATLCRLFFITFCIQNINVWMKWSQKGLLSLRSPFPGAEQGSRIPPHPVGRVLSVLHDIIFPRLARVLVFFVALSVRYFPSLLVRCLYADTPPPFFFTYFSRHDVCINSRSCKIGKIK